MENNPVPPPAEEQEKPTEKSTPDEKKPKKKKKRSILRTLIKIIIWLAVVAGVVYLTLELTWRIAQFTSMCEMLDYIRDQLT
jgi:cell division septal protein FtsQ